MEPTILAQLLDEIKVIKPDTKETKVPTIVCNIDGELLQFADENALKKFMFKERVDTVIRYDLVGEVTVPMKLITTEIK